MLGSVRSPLLGWNWVRAHDEAERRFFPNASEDYARSGLEQRAHFVQDVNDADTISLVRQLAPDAVVCLGGPIYRPELINECHPMINFHSGISPIYNGASTILFAFANGHVHLCGGTLMTMSPVVDGGDILAHFLPSIEPGDDPALLFMRTVRGAAEVCSQFLVYLREEGKFTRAIQSPPLFHCTAESWTVFQTQRIQRHIERNTVERHLRAVETVRYWDLSSDKEADAKARRTIERLLQLT